MGGGRNDSWSQADPDTKQTKKFGASMHTMRGGPTIDPSFQNSHSLMLPKTPTKSHNFIEINACAFYIVWCK